MQAVELILAFENQTTLPVDVNDVLSRLRKSGNDDDIEFIGVDLDPDVLQGAIKVAHVRDKVYGEPRRIVNIYYDRAQTVGWQRMICCKELLHLLDPEGARTYTPEQLERLAEEIGLPPEMQNPFDAAWGTNVDRLAEWRAAAILFPMAARNILLPHYENTLTLADIARQADIPPKYAGLVMHKNWDHLYGVLTGRIEPEAPAADAAKV